MTKTKIKINAISLFANIGVAEAYFDSIGVNVVAANELIQRRAKLYQKIYPKTKMICGDIERDIRHGTARVPKQAVATKYR